MDEAKRTQAHRILEQHLASRRMRRTPERAHILDATLNYDGSFTADDLVNYIVTEGRMTISRMTVYATLDLLNQCGLVHKRAFGGRAASYESSVAPAGEPVLRLVCKRCGKVKTLKSHIDLSPLSTRKYAGFHPDNIDVVVNGICTACLRRR